MPDDNLPDEEAPVELPAEEAYPPPVALTPEERYANDVAASLEPDEEDYGHFEKVVGRNEPEPQTVDEKAPDAPVEFDPRFRDEFEGLLFVGKLQKRFTWMGHVFVIRTLYINEVLEVGLLAKPYIGTVGDLKAYQSAVCAACIVSIDGKPLPRPITNEPDDTDLSNAFEYINRTWSPIVIDGVYSQYLTLERKVTEVMAAMGGARG